MMRRAVAWALALAGIVVGSVVAGTTAATRASAATNSTNDALFPRPPGIQARIRLWTRVYSEVESTGGLIHDSEDLDVVYEVIRWPKSISAGEQEARIARAKSHYQAILERLASGKTSLTPEERRVLALFPPGVSRASLAAAADRVRFQRGLAERFRDGLVRAGQWAPYIREVMRDSGVPQELAALPHVESSFNPVAYSHAGAAGLWQFMPSTGRLYLRIDRAVDERYDPWKSSEAAAKLLGSNYRALGKWPLAITAYNHGAGGMARAVKQLGTDDIAVIIDRYESDSFGFASRNFYTEFLAASDVEAAAARHFGALSREKPAQHELVVTRYPTSAAALARTFGIDIGLLRELNLGLRDSVWDGRIAVPAGYAVRLPKVAGREPADRLLASLPRSGGASASESAADGSTSRYRVKRGDTMATIAKKYGVTTTDLAKANRLRPGGHLRVGQVLKVPRGATGGAGTGDEVVVAAEGGSKPGVKNVKKSAVEKSAATAQADPGKPAKAKTRSYTVKKGETLSTIARNKGVSVKQLAAANGLPATHRVRAGQRLVIPD